MELNRKNYVWTHIKDLSELENMRMGAMKIFLEDYEDGRREGRYICHRLPERIGVEAKAYDIGLSSH